MGIDVVRLLAYGCLLACVTTDDVDRAIVVGNSASEHYRRGVDLYAKKQLDGAIRELNEAIRLDPTSASAHCCRAIALNDKGDFASAISGYSEVLRIDPKHVWAFNNRGNSRAARGEFAGAIADYSEAARLDPSYAPPFKNRAWILATCPIVSVRNGQKAIESAKTGCELTDWKEPSYLEALAAAFAEAGDFDSAISTQSKAMGLISDLAPRLKQYQDRRRLDGVAELNARLVQSRPLAFASHDQSRSLFIVPYDAILYLSPAGGSAGAVTEFGLGTSEDEHTAIFTGLPAEPQPNKEVKVGFVKAGSELHFYVKTDWGGIRWAFSHDANSKAARVAFGDRDNSLGREGSIVEKTGPTTWLLRLDDAGSVDVDDNDEDVLIEMRLVPAAPPAKPEVP